MDPITPVIEIIETDSPDEDGMVVPNDVRINGQSLLCADEPIIVSEISTESRDCVRVTVTFIARRVYIGPEVKPESEPTPEEQLAEAKRLQAERHERLIQK